VVVGQPAAALAITTTKVDVKCFAGNNGSATAIVTGGTTAYSYSWNTSPVQTTATATGLIAGTYTVTVTDANLCTQSASVVVGQPAAALAVSITPSNPVICNGATVNLNASASGGTGPYTYAWDNSLGSGASKSVSPTTTTVYTVTVTDANLCTVTNTVNITVNPMPTATLASATICAGQSTTLTPTGLANAATFSWSNGQTTSTITVTPTVTTQYTLTVTSGAGCSITRSVWVEVNQLPTAELTTIASLCLGSVAQNNGQLMLNKYRDTDQVSWNEGTSYVAPPTATAFAYLPQGGIFKTGLPNTTTNYTVRVKNFTNGCYIDITKPMTATVCVCPAGYCEPATVTKTK
jgi:hypothetical protein